MDAFVTFVLISGVYAVSEKKGVLSIALVLALLTLVPHWVIHLVEIPKFLVVGKVFGAFLFAYLAIILMSYLFKAKNITSDIILGAICAYFLVGLMWAYIFVTMEIFQPGSFQIARGMMTDSQPFVYYSFVTLTTLGYGDITPLTSQARSLSLLEAVFGQIYLAVVIARLVGIQITQSMESKRQ